jgi:Zn-dependent peptidase ImmA (M78 family)
VTDTLRPVIVISGEAPGDRLRFSVAHELGHLVMHQSIRGDLGAIEREADAFAGEFLVPEVVAKADITSPVTLTGISHLKPKWGVSVQALIRRAFDLGIVTQRQYTYLMQQVSAHGWRKREPPNLDIPVEKPRIIPQMAEMIYGLPLDYRKMAEEMNISNQMAKEIFEAQAGQRRVRLHEQGKTVTSILMFKKTPDKT